ncbi:MAG: hypothetical protein LBR21_00720 [Propionibacteriaceae bacterium]|jgi:hypothetical protein|nr:hypothetical protein [Propionibacteriaceae bacterium]
MAKHKLRQVLTSAIVALGIALFLPQASANSTTATSEPDQTMINRAFLGSLSPDEQQYLIENYPDLAAHLPGKYVVTEEIVPLPSSRAAGKCKTHRGKGELKSLLGFTIFKFSHAAKVCTNGSKVTSHSKPTYEITDPDILIESWKVVDRSVSGVGTGSSRSRIQVQVKHCVVKYGCYATYYPTGVISVTKTGREKVTTTV